MQGLGKLWVSIREALIGAGGASGMDLPRPRSEVAAEARLGELIECLHNILEELSAE